MEDILTIIITVLIILWEIIKLVWSYTLGWIINNFALLISAHPKVFVIVLLSLIWILFRCARISDELENKLEEAKELINELSDELEEAKELIDELED
jgi:F0F1-type ATP synthase membrane subunit b/b'